MDAEGGTAIGKRRKTLFTDRYGQKKIICHECGHRKPRSTYYDTCYRGIDCTPSAGYESEHTQAPGEEPPFDSEGQAAKRRLLDGGGHHEIEFMQPELHKQQVEGTGADKSAAKGLQGVLLVTEAPLTPVVLPEEDSLVSQEMKATTVKGEGERWQAPLAEGGVQEQLAAEALNHLDPTSSEENDFGPLECSDMAQSSGEEVGESESEEQSNSSSNDGEDEVSAATHELAMDMLQMFNELGEDAAYNDMSDDEAGEQAKNVEAAAAYLCKRLKQGSLAGMEDEEEDEGDDWADEHRQMEVEGNGEEQGPWRSRREQPLYSIAGGPSEKTVLTAAMEALREKMLYGVRDNAFNAMCKRTAATLPQPNQFPPSLYAMKQVVGVEPLHDFEEHVCVNECGPFPKLPVDKWIDHKDDRCPVCDELRFEAYKTKRGPRLRARKCFYSFAIERPIAKLYADAEFCKVRREDGARNTEEDDFWGSPYCQELNRKVGGLLWKIENGGYELGFDFARIYKVLQYSAGFLFIRSVDVPSHRRTESRFCKVVAVFPGPKEPAWIAPYFASLLNDFLYGWKKGFKLFDSYLRKTVQHHALLVMVHSDTKARNLVQEFVAVNAIIGCGRCWLEGMKYDDPGSKGGTYFKGYSKPAPQNVHGGGRKIFATEAELRTHEQHLAHAKRVEAGVEDVEECGYKGVPVIAQYLPYVDLIQAFPLPVAHCLLLGLVKSFWKYVLRKLKNGEEPPEGVLPASSRKAMEQWRIRRTHDGGRPSANVVKHLGSLTMEDLLHITETDSLVFIQYLNPAFARAWGHLRLAVVQCLREVEVPDGVPPMSAAGDNLLQYAKIVEEVMTSDMCTFNLHMATLHLRQQEQQTGSVRATSEFWVERGIQKMKACTTNGKLTRDPEKLIFNNLLLEEALFDRAREYPEYAPLLGLTEEEDPSEFKGVTDKAAPDSVLQLLHVGKEVKPSPWLFDELRKVAFDVQFPVNVEACRVFQFTAARCAHGVVQSTAHLRTVSRESWHVELFGPLQNRRPSKKVYADVIRFLKVESEDGAATFRAAEVVAYQRGKLRNGVEVLDELGPETERTFVALERIGPKVMFARHEKKKGKIFVLPTYTGRL